MPKNLKRNTQKPAKKAKSFENVSSRNMTRLEHARQNIFESPSYNLNRNCPEFVVLNIKATFKKLERKMFNKIKDFSRLGLFCFFFNITKYMRSR